MFFDPTFLILIPALIISAYAQYKVKSAYATYSKVRSYNGYTGSQVARMLLDSEGLYDVPVEIVAGHLTDHYDPAHRVMRLSEAVFHGNSVAALGIAAHETGHAVQHKESYYPLKFRNTIFPVANLGSSFSWILFVAGFFFGIKYLITLGILLFSLLVIFQLVTLPVEFNASSRALAMLKSRGIVLNDEGRGARAVLNAAALTYVAATLVAVSQLIRLILLSNRDRER